MTEESTSTPEDDKNTPKETPVTSVEFELTKEEIESIAIPLAEAVTKFLQK